MKTNMQENFELLKGRVIDVLDKTDLEYIKYELSKINEPTVVSGVGGSNVVSEFASKVLREKNKIISINAEPRDFNYDNFYGFKNILSCSYGGNNYGVTMSFNNYLKKYLLASNKYEDENITYLNYNTSMPRENSFISLGATLIPISVLLNYYLDGNNDFILDNIKETVFDIDNRINIYEIFTGNDTSVASKYLESTFLEAGLGIPIIHDKYDYCHGRSTISTNYKNNVIYFNRDTEFDKMILEELKKYYNQIIVIDSISNDLIKDDYQMLIKSMYLTKHLAEIQNIDLSIVKYSPLVKKLYKYNGQI